MPRKRPSSQPATPTEQQRERAWKAVANFNRMSGTLQSFARNFTGNSAVRVKHAKATYTDGKNIFIRPPIELGDELRHERTLCDQRDATRASLCPACRANDAAWQRLFHEISHISAGTFEYPQKLDAVMSFIDEMHPAGVCDHAPDMKQKVRSATDYQQVWGSVDPYLNLLLQYVEDGRVDSTMISVRPGLKSMYMASQYDAMVNGIESDQGKVFWRDQAINAQILIGILIYSGGGYVQPGWVSDQAYSVLNDPDILDICQNLANTSVHEASNRTADLARLLVSKGAIEVFQCKPQPETPSLDQEKDPDGGASNDGDSDDQDKSESQDDPSQSSEGADGDRSDSGSGDDDRSSEKSDEDSSGEAGNGEESDSSPDRTEDESVEDGGSDGEDSEGGDSNPESEDSQVPDGDSDDSGISGPESNDGPQNDKSESKRDDQADADGSSGNQDSDDSAEDHREEGSGSPLESKDSTVDSGSDGKRDASEPVRDGSREPDEDSDSRESDDSEVLRMDSARESADDSGTDGDADEESATDGNDPYVGDESVWNEEHDTSELTGADLGGDRESMATVEEIKKLLDDSHSHDDVPHLTDEEIKQALAAGSPEDGGDPSALQVALNKAITQSDVFDTSSVELSGVVEYTYPSAPLHWGRGRYNHGQPIESLMPSESVIGRALLKARITFAENARTKNNRHQKSGRVDTKVLGRRAALNDERLFRKRELPQRRDYLVGITIDCSGSNQLNRNMERAKRAAFAKAELLNRLGVKFYITAHTGGMEKWYTEGWSYADKDDINLHIMWVKKVDEAWNDDTRKRLAEVRPMADNFDGHTLEFHRKYLASQRATDKILIYYTDGAMPAANADEELEIMTRELDLMKRMGIVKLAVGIGTDSPRQYGFETVEVNRDEDLTKVVDMLEKQLTR